MIDAAAGPDHLDEIVARLASQSRRRIPMLAFGLLLLLASFGYFVVNLRSALRAEAQARTVAEQGRVDAEARANGLADTLEKARVAYTKRRFGDVGTLLKAAINEAERSAQVARTSTDAPAPIPSAQLQPVSGSAQVSLSGSADGYRQPVYLQFAGLLERGQIVSLNRALKDAGWNVQGDSGERTGRAAGLNEVRYAGDNRDAALALAQALTRASLTGPVRIKEMPIVKQNLEVWISRT